MCEKGTAVPKEIDISALQQQQLPKGTGTNGVVRSQHGSTGSASAKKVCGALSLRSSSRKGAKLDEQFKNNFTAIPIAKKESADDTLHTSTAGAATKRGFNPPPSCALCGCVYNALPVNVSYRAVVELRLRWRGSVAMVARPRIPPSALYRTTSVCRFCGQFFGVFLGERYPEDDRFSIPPVSVMSGTQRHHNKHGGSASASSSPNAPHPDEAQISTRSSSSDSYSEDESTSSRSFDLSSAARGENKQEDSPKRANLPPQVPPLPLQQRKPKTIVPKLKRWKPRTDPAAALSGAPSAETYFAMHDLPKELDKPPRAATATTAEPPERLLCEVQPRSCRGSK